MNTGSVSVPHICMKVQKESASAADRSPALEAALVTTHPSVSLCKFPPLLQSPPPPPPNALNSNTSLKYVFLLLHHARGLLLMHLHKLTGSSRTGQTDERGIRQGDSFPDPGERRHGTPPQRRQGRIPPSYITRSALTEQNKSGWMEPPSTTQRSQHTHVGRLPGPFNSRDGSVTSLHSQNLHWLGENTITDVADQQASAAHSQS